MTICMHNGVIEFRRPEQCELRRTVNNMQFRSIATSDDNCDREIQGEVDV